VATLLRNIAYILYDINYNDRSLCVKSVSCCIQTEGMFQVICMMMMMMISEVARSQSFTVVILCISRLFTVHVFDVQPFPGRSAVTVLYQRVLLCMLLTLLVQICLSSPVVTYRQQNRHQHVTYMLLMLLCVVMAPSHNRLQSCHEASSQTRRSM